MDPLDFQTKDYGSLKLAAHERLQSSPSIHYFAHLETRKLFYFCAQCLTFVQFFTHNFLSKFLKINLILNLRNLFRVNMIEYAWIILIWDIFYIYFPFVITKSVKYYFSDKKIRRNLLKPTKNDQFYEEPTITVIRLIRTKFNASKDLLHSNKKVHGHNYCLYR